MYDAQGLVDVSSIKRWGQKEVNKVLSACSRLKWKERRRRERTCVCFLRKNGENARGKWWKGRDASLIGQG